LTPAILMGSSSFSLGLLAEPLMEVDDRTTPPPAPPLTESEKAGVGCPARKAQCSTDSRVFFRVNTTGLGRTTGGVGESDLGVEPGGDSASAGG
jgi:hypothetical protein